MRYPFYVSSLADINCKKTAVYAQLNSDVTHLKLQKIQKAIVPTTTSPKCQCAAE